MREEQIKKLKRFLQQNYPNVQAFDSRNWCGDIMQNVYNEDGIQVDYCECWEYLEIFGLTEEEFDGLIQKNTFGNLRTFNEEEL